MSLRHSAKDNSAADRRSQRTKLDLRYVTSLGCIGLLGGGAVFAQVGIDPLEKSLPSPEPTVSAPASPASSASSDLRGVPAEVIFDAPVSAEPIADPVTIEPATPLPSVLDDLPAPSEPASTHSYIDNTDYSLGATEISPDRDAPIVFEERNSGCASALAPGQALANGLCADAVVGRTGGGASGTPTPYASPSYGSNSASGASRSFGSGAAGASSATGATMYPINLSDRSSSFDPYAAAGLSYAQLEAQVTRNIATMPFGRIGNGDRGLIFPVSVPAPISSFFGFRIHPIAQTQRLHTGTDIAAPYGTPVLAAFSGEVIESSDLGGYGLTVVLSHNDGTSETLYAHMSELLVNVGDDVKQGDPIGRVGSTGFSTGPHLHFEVKQMTDMGWVYLDANRQLEVALERLIDSSQLAQLPRRDRGSL